MNRKKTNWKTGHIVRMWPRALFHMRKGKKVLRAALKSPGVYVLYRDDRPYYVGKTRNPLIRRLGGHALKPNWRRYNFWNYFSAFDIKDETHRNEIEAILISAMPTAANSSRPKIPPMRSNRDAARLLNDVQAQMMTGERDMSGETNPEETMDEDDA